MRSSRRAPSATMRELRSGAASFAPALFRVRMTRRTLIIVFVLSALASGTVFWLIDRGDERAVRRPPARPDETVVTVWQARDGDLEYLLRPFHLEEDRDSFTQARLQQLASTAAEKFRFAVLWVLNHGVDPCDPAVDVATTISGRDERVAVPVDLWLKSRTDLPAYLAPILAAGQATGRERLAAGEFARYFFVFPGDEPLREDLGPRLASKERRLDLATATVSVAELLAYEENPRGVVESLLKKSATVEQGATQVSERRPPPPK